MPWSTTSARPAGATWPSSASANRRTARPVRSQRRSSLVRAAARLTPLTTVPPARAGHGADAAQNEAAILRNLQHPNIVRLMAVILEENELADGSSWGSMNLLQELAAMNLWQFIERHGRTELGPALLRSFTQNILDALIFLHANRIVHHDIKPHNLLVRARRGRRWAVRRLRSG